MKKKLPYILLSLFFIIFFIYILFPYSLIKEVGIDKLQTYLSQAGLASEINAESLKGYWFTGIEIKQLEIKRQGDSKRVLRIKKITSRLSVVPLLWGNVNVSSHLEIEKGEGDILVTLSLFDLFSGKFTINKVDANFDNLKLDGIFGQAISLLKNSPNSNYALLVPVISEGSMGGFLNGTIYYVNDDNAPSLFNLKVNKAFIDLNNMALGIPKQNFTHASLVAEYNNSILNIKKETVFTSQNLSFSINGIIKNQKKPSKQQLADLMLKMFLSGQMEKNFGFLLPQMLNCPSTSMIGGNMNVKLTGPLDKLTCHD